MTQLRRQNDENRKCDRKWQSDGGSSHQHFRFAPPWSNQPSIMHHTYPSNSREPSNRILATASNCCLLVCGPIGKRCVSCGEANQEEPGQRESKVGVFLYTADWAHMHIQTHTHCQIQWCEALGEKMQTWLVLCETVSAPKPETWLFHPCN